MADLRITQKVNYALNLAGFSIILNILTLFVILLRWNTSGNKPEWEAVSVSLTVLEVFLALIALGGFWLFRGIVKDHADHVARKVAREIAEEEAAERAEVVALRAAEAAIAAKFDSDDTLTQAQVDAFSEENGD